MQKTHTLPEAEYGRDALAKVRLSLSLNRWKGVETLWYLLMYLYIGTCQTV
jgi:hypothetical protein